MKNIKITNISVKGESKPFNLLIDAFKTRKFSGDPGNDGLLKESDVMSEAVYFEDDPLNLKMKDLVKIELKFEDAFPTDNFANFRIDDQLMLGVMFNEQEQKITGYLKQPPGKKVTVTIEHPDGEKTKIQLDVERV